MNEVFSAAAPSGASSARLGTLLGLGVATPCLVRALAHGGERYFLPRARDRKRRRSTYFDAAEEGHEKHALKPEKNTKNPSTTAAEPTPDVLSMDLATAAVLQQVPLAEFCSAGPRMETVAAGAGGAGGAARRPANAFFGRGDDRVVVLTCRDPSVDGGALFGQGAKGTTVNTSKGFKTVDGARYGAIVRQMRPHIACGLALSPSGHAGSKRLRKTVDGTCQLFQQFLDAVGGGKSDLDSINSSGSGTSSGSNSTTMSRSATADDDGIKTAIFAPIVGGADMRERLRSLEGMLKVRGDRAPDGYLLAGFSQGETRAQRKKLLDALVQRLPAAAPRMYECATSPVDVLNAVRDGMDMIACSFPDDLTRSCCAATFDVELEARSRVAEGGDDGSGVVVVVTDKMCLRDQIYQRDLRPMVPGCTCYACANHTRAYIHHLVTVHEIMGKALLDAHNWHHAQRFAREIRERVGAGTLEAYAATF
jgi:hypothetical protein